ncbi:hypothetical protein [Streptomyces sp. HM190]|uniref:hypothetical protein n=1 Tax=Streptomyces sp. HM190 TaxID=2695266 RepID=UPI001F2CDDD9|nr:hypothetical protein [Streptomyces sp. HM190]
MTGLVLVTGLLMVPVAGSAPSVHAAVEPDPASSWAGSRAGEGRERPGRPDAGLTEPEDPYGASEEPTGAPHDPAGTTTATPEPSQDAALPVASPADRADAEAREGPVLEALALGGGLMLMGIGLGLAFVGLRIRRG